MKFNPNLFFPYPPNNIPHNPFPYLGNDLKNNRCMNLIPQHPYNSINQLNRCLAIERALHSINNPYHCYSSSLPNRNHFINIPQKLSSPNNHPPPIFKKPSKEIETIVISDDEQKVIPTEQLQHPIKNIPKHPSLSLQNTQPHQKSIDNITLPTPTIKKNSKKAPNPQEKQQPQFKIIKPKNQIHKNQKPQKFVHRGERYSNRQKKQKSIFKEYQTRQINKGQQTCGRVRIGKQYQSTLPSIIDNPSGYYSIIQKNLFGLTKKGKVFYKEKFVDLIILQLQFFYIPNIAEQKQPYFYYLNFQTKLSLYFSNSFKNKLKQSSKLQLLNSYLHIQLFIQQVYIQQILNIKKQLMKKNLSLNKQQKKHVEDFIQTAHCHEDDAIKFLSNAKWNVQQALNAFYDSGGGTIPANKQIPQVQQLFTKIATNDSIQPQGFKALISQYMKIDEQNTVIGHILTNVMKVPKASIANIPKQSLYNLFQYCNAKTLKDVIKFIPKLQKQHKQPKVYESLYMKLYDLYLSQNITTLDFDYAQALWTYYLKDQLVFYKQFLSYIEKLREKNKNPPKVHKDLWRMVYQFSKCVKKIQDHKIDDMWPGFLDDFVEYIKQLKGIKQ